MRPFLKWAGGKRWMFDSRQFQMPDYTGTYREPFLGGGAVFFQTLPGQAVLSDSNRRLIELYEAIRDSHQELVLWMQGHGECHSKDYYYQVRAMVIEDPVQRAAQFLYLNRTCFNGLYRENRRGEFNVPIGTKDTVLFDHDDFDGWAKALEDTVLIAGDFEDAIDAADDGDFVFVDPPYTVKHNLNGFIKYNQKMFAWEDQVRLRDALKRAVSRGASFAMTNADHDSIRELYEDFGSYRQMHRSSVIGGPARTRSKTTELLVFDQSNVSAA